MGIINTLSGAVGMLVLTLLLVLASVTFSIVLWLGLKAVLNFVGERIGIEPTRGLKISIIGGIIGGVVFASMSPLVTPVIYDAHVESGLVDRPTIAYKSSHWGAERGRDVFEGPRIDWEEDFFVYRIEIINLGEKPIDDLGGWVELPGCIVNSTITTRDLHGGLRPSAYITDRHISGVRDDTRIHPCSTSSFATGKFESGQKLTVTFVVDSKPGEDFSSSLSRYQVHLTNNYHWTYNGREYRESDVVRLDVRSSRKVVPGTGCGSLHRCIAEVLS